MPVQFPSVRSQSCFSRECSPFGFVIRESARSAARARELCDPASYANRLQLRTSAIIPISLFAKSRIPPQHLPAHTERHAPRRKRAVVSQRKRGQPCQQIHACGNRGARRKRLDENTPRLNHLPHPGSIHCDPHKAHHTTSPARPAYRRQKLLHRHANHLVSQARVYAPRPRIHLNSNQGRRHSRGRDPDTQYSAIWLAGRHIHRLHPRGCKRQRAVPPASPGHSPKLRRMRTCLRMLLMCPMLYSSRSLLSLCIAK